MKTPQKRQVKYYFTWLFLLTCIGLTCLVTIQAWQNNPSCAFVCKGITDWDSIGLFAIAMFTVSTIPATYAAVSLTFIGHFLYSLSRAIWQAINH